MLTSQTNFRTLVVLSAILILLGSCNKEPNQKIDLIPDRGELGYSIKNDASIEGYSDKVAYYAGDKMRLMLSASDASFCSVVIWRLGLTNERVFLQKNVPISRQDYFKYSYSYGCDWDTTLTVKIGDGWNSGLYSAQVSVSPGEYDFITFIVKEKREDPDKAPVLVIASTNTWQAYNSWGGASFYRYGLNDADEDIRHSVIVSFRRPNNIDSPEGDFGHLVDAELYLIKWLEENGIDYAMGTDRDIHGAKFQFQDRKAVILHVHPEYYTSEMLDNLEGFNAEGGGVLYLGGNGLYWKTGLSNNFQIECRKNGDEHRFAEGTGGYWRDHGRSPALFVGSHYSSKGFRTWAPYETLLPEHWVFEGTDLVAGQTFGEEGLNGGGASGHETDKVTNDTPADFILVAKGTNPDDGGADMLIRERPGYGLVFSVGSVSYTGALSTDPNIHQITMNVLDRCLQ